MNSQEYSDFRVPDEGFPYNDAAVPFIALSAEHGLMWAKSVTDKRQMLLLLKSFDDVLLAPWPGRWSTDVFILDIDKAYNALLGAKP
jgi:hypothetical protein